MSEKLNHIREQIDSLDNQIHDLLMRRADLIVDVVAEKKKSGKPVVQPAREAMMVRRLLSRHKGVLPQAAVVGIWRELVGAVCLLQKGLHVRVTAGEGLEFCWDAAKNYFGSVLPMSRTTSALQVISLVREDDANIGVVPWPCETQALAWWSHLMHQDPHMNGSQPMRIVGALPYGTQQKIEHIVQKSLIIGRTEYAQSGDDHSFVAVEIDRDVSRGRLCDYLGTLGLNALGVCTIPSQNVADQSIHLIEVDDYISEQDDPRMMQMAQAFENHQAVLLVLGGYPVPPVFGEGDREKLEGRMA